MIDDPLSEFTRRRLAQMSEAALRAAGVVGVFPTDVEAVQKAVGVVERLEMTKLPEVVRAKKPSRTKRLLGALWYEERTVFIDTDQRLERVHFTDAHEAVHAMCPWHEDILRLDTEDELFRHLHPGIELEANYGAGHLIFQGGRFHHVALEDRVSIRAPLALADEFGASMHAATHYYVQEHPDAVALLIAGRMTRADGTVPVWQSVESTSFAERYGRFRDLLPGGELKVVDGPGAPFAEIIRQSKTLLDPPSANVQLLDRGGRLRNAVAEAFFNQHCQFVFVAERRAARFGRRSRLSATGA